MAEAREGSRRERNMESFIQMSLFICIFCVHGAQGSSTPPNLLRPWRASPLISTSLFSIANMSMLIINYSNFGTIWNYLTEANGRNGWFFFKSIKRCFEKYLNKNGRFFVLLERVSWVIFFLTSWYLKEGKESVSVPSHLIYYF